MRKLRRRTSWLLITGAVLSGAGITRLVKSQDSLSVPQAKQFIQASGDLLVGILNGASDWPEKRRLMEALISERMDVYGIARFAIGRFWHDANDRQRDEYMRLFPLVLISKISKIFGSYQGVKFVIDRGLRIDDSVEVWTTVFRPNVPLQQVSWVIGAVRGAIKIVDIMAEGASLRIVQRDNCVSFLTQNNNNIQALLEALRHEAELAS